MRGWLSGQRRWVTNPFSEREREFESRLSRKFKILYALSSSKREQCPFRLMELACGARLSRIKKFFWMQHFLSKKRLRGGARPQRVLKKIIRSASPLELLLLFQLLYLMYNPVLEILLG